MPDTAPDPFLTLFIVRWLWPAGVTVRGLLAASPRVWNAALEAAIQEALCATIGERPC